MDELERFKESVIYRIKSGDLSPEQAVQVIEMKRAEIQANRIEGEIKETRDIYEPNNLITQINRSNYELDFYYDELEAAVSDGRLSESDAAYLLEKKVAQIKQDIFEQRLQQQPGGKEFLEFLNQAKQRSQGPFYEILGDVKWHPAQLMPSSFFFEPTTQTRDIRGLTQLGDSNGSPTNVGFIPWGESNKKAKKQPKRSPTERKLRQEIAKRRKQEQNRIEQKRYEDRAKNQPKRQGADGFSPSGNPYNKNSKSQRQNEYVKRKADQKAEQRAKQNANNRNEQVKRENVQDRRPDRRPAEKPVYGPQERPHRTQQQEIEQTRRDLRSRERKEQGANDAKVREREKADAYGPREKKYKTIDDELREAKKTAERSLRRQAQEEIDKFTKANKGNQEAIKQEKIRIKREQDAAMKEFAAEKRKELEKRWNAENGAVTPKDNRTKAQKRADKNAKTPNTGRRQSLEEQYKGSAGNSVDDRKEQIKNQENKAAKARYEKYLAEQAESGQKLKGKDKNAARKRFNDEAKKRADERWKQEGTPETIRKSKEKTKKVNTQKQIEYAQEQAAKEIAKSQKRDAKIASRARERDFKKSISQPPNKLPHPLRGSRSPGGPRGIGGLGMPGRNPYGNTGNAAGQITGDINSTFADMYQRQIVEKAIELAGGLDKYMQLSGEEQRKLRLQASNQVTPYADALKELWDEARKYGGKAKRKLDKLWHDIFNPRPDPLMPKGGLGKGLGPTRRGIEGLPAKKHPWDNPAHPMHPSNPWRSPWSKKSPEEIDRDLLPWEPWRKPGYFPGQDDPPNPDQDPNDPDRKPAGELPSPPIDVDPAKPSWRVIWTLNHPTTGAPGRGPHEYLVVSRQKPVVQLVDIGRQFTNPDPGARVIALLINGLELASNGSKWFAPNSSEQIDYTFEIEIQELTPGKSPVRTAPAPPLTKPKPKPKTPTKPWNPPTPKPEPPPAPDRDPEPKPLPAPAPEPKPNPPKNPWHPPKTQPKPPTKPNPEPKPQPKPQPKPEPEPEKPPKPLPKPKSPKNPEPKPDPSKPKNPEPKPEPKRSRFTFANPIPSPPKDDDEDPDMPCRYMQDMEQTVSLNRYDPLSKTMKPETFMVHQGIAEALQFLSNEIAELKRSNQQINNVTEAADIDTKGKVINPKREIQKASLMSGLTGNITIKTLGEQTAAYASVGQKKLDSIARFLKIKQIMDALTFVTVLHNAAMLSKSLAETLGDLTGNVMTVVGRFTGVIDDEADIDVNEILGESFNEFMKNLLGKEVWEGTKTNWKKANNVFSSASQILWTVRSMGDSAKEIAEWTAENTGKIGNSLKRYGVVGENAYPWMAENVKGQGKWDERVRRYRDGVENLEDAASSLDSVTSEARNIQDEMKELKEQKEKFDKNIAEAAAIVRPDNKPNQEAATKAKAESGGKDASDDDLKKGE